MKIDAYTKQLRHKNEDALYCSPDTGVFLVADGRSGEKSEWQVASRYATINIGENMTYQLENRPGMTEREILELLKSTISEAHQKLRGTNGTTLEAVVLREKEFLYAHVGDSRIYVYENQRLSQITEDESLGGRGPSRYLGIAGTLEINPKKKDLNENTAYVFLATDGLFTWLTNGDLEEIFREYSQEPEVIFKKIEERKERPKGIIKELLSDYSYYRKIMDLVCGKFPETKKEIDKLTSQREISEYVLKLVEKDKDIEETVSVESGKLMGEDNNQKDDVSLILIDLKALKTRSSEEIYRLRSEVKEKKEELTQKDMKYGAELTEKERECSMLKTDKAGLEKQLETKEEKCGRLSSDLRESERKYSELKSEKKKAENQLETKERELEATQQIIKRTGEAIPDKYKKYGGTIDKAMGSLAADLNESEQKCSGLKAEKNGLERRLSTETEGNKELRAEHEKLRYAQQTITAIEKQVSTYGQEGETVANTVSKVVSTLEASKIENNGLKKEKSGLETQVETLKRTEGELQKKYDKLAQENINLQVKYSGHKSPEEYQKMEQRAESAEENLKVFNAPLVTSLLEEKEEVEKGMEKILKEGWEEI